MSRRALTVVACVALFALAVAAAAREAIERAYVQHVLTSVLDADVTIGALHHDGDLTTLDGVHVRTVSGVDISADSVAYGVHDGAWDVTPAALHVTLGRVAFDGSEARRFSAAARDLGIRRVTLHLRDAGIDLAGADAAKLVEIAGIGGTIAWGAAPAWDLHGTWIDDASPSGAYPVAVRTSSLNDRLVPTFAADALPLAGIGALLGTDPIAITGGTARGISATYESGIRATMTLDGVTAHVQDASLARIAGPFTIVGDGFGSSGLDAVLEPGDVPLAITGEVHDLRDATGSRDTRMIADAIGRIAAQPNLRWANVETTAPGIVYGQFAMTTKDVPHVVQSIAVDPHEPTLHFDTALADDHIISTGARTTDLGLRTHAVAGVNGDYFDIGRTYEPQGLLMRSGTLLHGPTDHEALIVDRANHPTFARFRLTGRVTDGDRTYPITLFNSWPTRDVAVITPDYGKTLPAAPGVTFAALRPLGGTRYRVTSLQPMAAAIPVAFGLGFSTSLDRPLPRAGDLVDVRYALDPPVAGAVAGIGSGPLLLRDGAWVEDAHAPAPDERDVQWPVIAIGARPDDTIVFVAVDGRHPERSIGMTRPEFAQLLQRLGVSDAMALDSGGSVTMVARSPGAQAITLHNVPSDNSYERYVSDALFVYSSAPQGTIVTVPRPHVEPTPGAK